MKNHIQKKLDSFHLSIFLDLGLRALAFKKYQKEVHE